MSAYLDIEKADRKWDENMQELAALNTKINTNTQDEKTNVENSIVLNANLATESELVKLEISSESHPFFTGKQKLFDSTGRDARFKQRYGSTSTRQAPKAEVSSQEEE